jgi:hypothetical protein
MTLSSEQLNQIREWARKVYDHILSEPPDTTPERIRVNRDKLLPYFQEMHDIFSPTILDQLTPPTKEKAEELLDDYMKYFNEGYQSKTNIDDFPDKLKQEFSRMVRFNA